jgi:hypothetical protein
MTTVLPQFGGVLGNYWGDNFFKPTPSTSALSSCCSPPSASATPAWVGCAESCWHAGLFRW